MSTAAKSPNPRRFLSADALIAGLRRWATAKIPGSARPPQG